MFGSAMTGGYSGAVSDVDLILVLPEDISPRDKQALREDVERLEVLHGFRDPSAGPQNGPEAFAQKVTANVRSFFLCTRADLLSSDPARILGIPRGQAFFVDRVVVPSILGSGATIYGADLLSQVSTPPIRRLDVFKACFGIFNQAVLSVALFPVVTSATKYAMGALKRSVHNCYFCYHLRPGSLTEEAAFFQTRPSSLPLWLTRSTATTLTQLLSLRSDYRRSLRFVIRCLPAVLCLHLRTALDNRFPREYRKPGVTGAAA